MSLCYKLSPFQAHWGRWHCTRFLRLACLFTAHVGSGPSPISCGVFLPLLLLQAFLLMIAGRVPLILPSPAGLFVYSSVRDCPSPSLRHSGCPTLFATCLFYSYCLLFSLFFCFSLGANQSVQGAMLSWPRVVCGSMVYHLAHLVICFSQAGYLLS
jgi:hypothetical protein